MLNVARNQNLLSAQQLGGKSNQASCILYAVNQKRKALLLVKNLTKMEHSDEVASPPVKSSATSNILESTVRRKKTSSWKVFEIRLILLDRGPTDEGKRTELVEKYGFSSAAFGSL